MSAREPSTRVLSVRPAFGLSGALRLDGATSGSSLVVTLVRTDIFVSVMLFVHGTFMTRRLSGMSIEAPVFWMRETEPQMGADMELAFTAIELLLSRATNY